VLYPSGSFSTSWFVYLFIHDLSQSFETMKSLWALCVYSMESQQNFGDSVKISVSKSIFQGQLKAMTKTVNGNQPRTIFLQFRYKTTFYSKIYTVSVVVSEALGSVALDAAAAAALALANPTPPPHPCRATCVVSSVRC